MSRIGSNKMKLIELLFDSLLKLGLQPLVEKLRGDYAMPNGHWHNYDCERKSLCSFLNIYLDHADDDARLTLFPDNADKDLIQEIITDVIPVIRRKLGV